MKALWLQNGRLEFTDRAPEPEPRPGDALIRVRAAGICGTDIALLGGVYPFTGVPGHEFVGTVERGPGELLGKRVVGEINTACGSCPRCLAGLTRHCARRAVLGIRGLSGAFAERLSLPAANLHRVPEGLADECAVFTEPLAAALAVLEDVSIAPGDRVLVLGAGKLGHLVARVVSPHCTEVVVTARTTGRLQRLSGHNIVTVPAAELNEGEFDLAIDCSGTSAAMASALDRLRPRGTLVLKTTYPAPVDLDAGSVVVRELRLVGSRCGPFRKALAMLSGGQIDVRALIDHRFDLEEGPRAFAAARRPGVLKVLLEIGR